VTVVRGTSMARAVTIRQATVNDAPALQRYIAELRAERLPVLLPIERVPTLEEERAFIRGLVEHETSTLLLAFRDQELVGTLDLQGSDRPGMEHCGRLGMSVARAYRTQGIGTHLLEEVLTWAVASGRIRRIELEVLAINPAAIALYRKMGFVQEGCKHQAVCAGGQLVDLLGMAYLLEGDQAPGRGQARPKSR
jgi:RimJ/RimL family protein N-acetyltransferase